MKKRILIAICVGLIVGLIVGICLNAIPALDNLMSDNMKSLITGGIAGGLAVIAMGRNNDSSE